MFNAPNFERCRTLLDFFGAAMHRRKAGRAGVVVDGFLDGLDGFLLADFSMFGLFERGPS